MLVIAGCSMTIIEGLGLVNSVDSRNAEAGAALQSFRIDTGNLVRKAGFALWQEELVPYWESRPCGNTQEPFRSVFECHLFGAVMIGRVGTPAQRIDRSRYRIARDGFSQYGLKIVLSGAIGKRDGHGESRAEAPGDVFLTDLSQPQAVESSDLDVLFVVMQRDLLAPLLKLPDEQNQRAISGQNPLTQLLRTHLTSLYHLAPSLNAVQAEAIMRPTLELIAAALNGEVSKTEIGAVRFAGTQEIRRYVEAHIRAPHLDAETIAAHFGLSRRKLYYLFQPFGGFAAYVQERRLNCIHADIVDPALQDRSVAGIAEAYGFGHYPSFVRAFRRAYDMSPREVKALGLQRSSTARATLTCNSWHNWFFQTR
ncbi:helix-turn-helix domain-containing protein [Devosia sp. A369]